MLYSTKYPSRPAAPMVSGGRHFTVTVVSVTSSTTSMVGSLVTALMEIKVLEIRGIINNPHFVSQQWIWTRSENILLASRKHESKAPFSLWLVCHQSPCQISLVSALPSILVFWIIYNSYWTLWKTWSPKSLIRRWFGSHYKDIFNIL